MRLSKVLGALRYEVLSGSVEKEVGSIVFNSGKAVPGSLFVCVTGFKTDGHRYAADACRRGAAAIVAERMPEGVPEGTAVIKTPDTRAAMAVISANFHGDPTKYITLAAVTGTNGKTTTTFLIKSILESAGHKTGLIGTIENRIGERVIHAEHTTPESPELQELFALMLSEGARHAVMEVSSHSLDLHRVDGCHFDIAIFTNLTQDHLDYHKTMENYKKAKAKLFERSRYSVINTDDPAGACMIEHSAGEVMTFGIDGPADLMAGNISITADGVGFDLEYKGKTYRVSLSIPGKFSIYNALGAIGACLFMDIPMEDIIKALGAAKGVPGRFQTIKGNNGVNAIVDYAHTPDGLENILSAARGFARGRIITVFGCGGDRDSLKRPIMGEIAGRLSDFCIITSDNPRSEDPEKIIDQTESGTKKTGCPYIRITDRREAIFKAVSMAEKDDLIILAGKGHENYQIFADKTIHFDDAEAVSEAFRVL